VGRIEPEKGQMEFVDAVKSISPYLPDCRFSVIGAPMFSGDDYYRAIVASSRGLPIDFIPWQEDVSQIYSELDLLVVPSGALEATTRVILEAFSAGVPVVAFPVGGIPEVVQDGHTGFLARGVTSEALAERILGVVQMNRSCLRCVATRAREEWRRRFTLAQYRDRVCDVLARAIQPRIQPLYDDLRTPTGVAAD
jgi:glycosyltransferase involved in cell wall biosynthesis